MWNMNSERRAWYLYIHNQKNQQWLSTVSTLTTISDYRTPNFSPPKQDTEIASSGKQLK
jgi:hypothetical protein